MKKAASDLSLAGQPSGQPLGQPMPTQTMQRIRVGITGLASVLILIALASAVFSSASHERPIAAVGAARPETVANLTDATIGNLASPNEPLAELGVAPSTTANSADAPSGR